MLMMTEHLEYQERSVEFTSVRQKMITIAFDFVKNYSYHLLPHLRPAEARQRYYFSDIVMYGMKFASICLV